MTVDRREKMWWQALDQGRQTVAELDVRFDLLASRLSGILVRADDRGEAAVLLTL